MPTTQLVRSGDRTGSARLVAEVRAWHGPLAAFAALMVVWSAVSLAGFVFDPRLLDGARIWAKPLKFAISLALYSLTFAWMISAVRNARLRRVAWWAGTVGAAAGLLEITVITVQVVRGTASHFNVSTPVDALLYEVMASGVVFLFGATLVIGIVLLFSSRVRDRSVDWALRLGLLIGVAGLSVGFLMVWPTAAQLANPHPDRIGSHSVGGDDPSGGLPFLGWNTEHGDLRIAHFVGMHALQILPLLAVALTFAFGGRLRAGTRLRIVLLAAAGYGAVFGLVLWQALRGQSIVAPDALTVTAAGIVVLVAAGFAVALLPRVRRDLAHREPAAGVPERRPPLLASPTTPPTTEP